MSDTVPMTLSGYAKLQREIAALEDKRPVIKKAIQEAREKGDLRENADYHASREELGMLNAKVAFLSDKIARAHVIESVGSVDGKAVFGNTVKFKRVLDGKEMTRILVGEGEQDHTSGKILCTSPIGKAIVGHSVGEIVTAELPKGNVELEILEIT